jgi:RNA recognition motif-containing protein
MSDHNSPRERNGRESSFDRRRGSSERGRSRDRERERDDKRNKDPDTYTQVYVAKLSRRTREEDLKQEFSKFGRIKNVTLKLSYAFIDFDDHESAVAAVKEMDGKAFVNGEELVVE